MIIFGLDRFEFQKQTSYLCIFISFTISNQKSCKKFVVNIIFHRTTYIHFRYSFGSPIRRYLRVKILVRNDSLNSSNIIPSIHRFNRKKSNWICIRANRNVDVVACNSWNCPYVKNLPLFATTLLIRFNFQNKEWFL